MREVHGRAPPVFRHSRWGGTALADAVREGHEHIAEFLRSKGGELLYDEIRASGELCKYARNGDVKSVKMLLDCGVDANTAAYDKRTALHVSPLQAANLSAVSVLHAHSPLEALLLCETCSD